MAPLSILPYKLHLVLIFWKISRYNLMKYGSYALNTHNKLDIFRKFWSKKEVECFVPFNWFFKKIKQIIFGGFLNVQSMK